MYITIIYNDRVQSTVRTAVRESDGCEWNGRPRSEPGSVVAALRRVSQEAAFGEADVHVAGDDEMVEHADFHQRQGGRAFTHRGSDDRESRVALVA